MKFAVVVLVLLWVDRGQGHGSSLTFELGDSERACFKERFTGSTKYIFDYKVVRGGNNDVDASIISPNRKIIYKETKKTGDKIIFDTSEGEFEFCFSNEFSTFSHKVVSLDLRPENLNNLAVEAGNLRPGVATSSESSCNEIHESMADVVDVQRALRLREAKGRFQAEVLNQRVLWWSLSQSVIIMSAGIGQVLILKWFFTVNRNLLLPTNGEVVHCRPAAQDA